MEPKISVIIPVYRVEPYLQQCVESVLCQTYSNLEIILVDDGSPDACPQLCDAFAAQDSRVKVIHKDNGGLSDARNAGVAAASGAYGLFLDSDDYWNDHTCVSRLVSRLRQREYACDVLSFPYYKLEETTGIKINNYEGWGDMPADLTDKVSQLEYLTARSLYIASACNKLIRMPLLRRIPFAVGVVSEDVDWCARLMAAARSFDYVACAFYCYRQRAGSIAHSSTEKGCRDLQHAVMRCVKVAEEAEKAIRPYLLRYAAYQLATFVATQAFPRRFPAQCVRELASYTWLFSYHGGNRKVRIIGISCRCVGFTFTCRLVRWTKKIWDGRRSAFD